MEDQADEPGILVEVAKLRGDVAVIDVDGNGADLEAGEHPLEVLAPVGQLQADAVAGADAGAREMVREAVGPTVELGVGEPTVVGDDGRLLRDDVDHALEEVGQIEFHRRSFPARSSFTFLDVVWLGQARDRLARMDAASLEGAHGERPVHRGRSLARGHGRRRVAA